VAVLGAGLAMGIWGSAGSAGGSEPVHLTGTGTASRTALPGAEPTALDGPLRAFAISGSVHGLYPGAGRPLALTVSNPLPVPLEVTALTTTVVAGAPGCPATDLTVTGATVPLHVPAHGSTGVTVTATLAHAAPDACQGVSFGLRYAGLGIKK
jgi:hypothetical protein